MLVSQWNRSGTDDQKIRWGPPMQQIADWLEMLGMSECAQRFPKNRIDFPLLRDLTDQDLEKLGIVFGDRRKGASEMLVSATDTPQRLGTAGEGMERWIGNVGVDLTLLSFLALLWQLRRQRAIRKPMRRMQHRPAAHVASSSRLRSRRRSSTPQRFR
jgi:hypothetical protein